MSIKSSKNNSNENINVENGLSFGRHGLLEGNINFNNNLNLNTKKNTRQLLNEINNDMDLLFIKIKLKIMIIMNLTEKIKKSKI